MKELQEITDKIRELKELRFKKYGKYWFEDLRRQKRWDKDTKAYYMQNLKDYMKENKLNITKMSKMIGMARNTYTRMQKHDINSKNQEKIERFFKEKSK